jgi:hypothetical protein
MRAEIKEETRRRGLNFVCSKVKFAAAAAAEE